MQFFQSLVVICYFGVVTGAQIWPNSLVRRRQQLKTALNLNNRIKQRINLYRERNTKSVCYDVVGCFSLPHKNSPLQKIPEDPQLLNTKSYLFTRKTSLASPEMLEHDDNGQSLIASSFNASNLLKVVVHGYLSKWNEKGAVLIMNTYLKMYDCNVILLDWQIGARGPHYPVAAANTELVGRQLGILLTAMVKYGLDPKNIHLIGFSLGAHVCGTASESLKNEGFLLGRITGLDPASPLFRNNYLRENYKKLDRSDAKFVDVIHTDSSPYLTDGFGLWDPIGHVDFFPNGGQDQPGCNDVPDSIVVSHFERGLSKELVCSHVRAFLLYREALLNQLERRNGKKSSCEFIAYNCPKGREAFEEGSCFPQLSKKSAYDVMDSAYGSEIGTIGEDVKGEGVMFFSTKSSSQYCGSQMQASVELSNKSGPLKGIIQLQLIYDNNSVVFQINCEFKTTDLYNKTIYGLGVANYNSLSRNVTELQARLKYSHTEYSDAKINSVPLLYFNKVLVRDMYGYSWEYCKPNTKLESNGQLNELLTSLTIKRNSCGNK